MLRHVTCLARLSPRLSSLPRRARRTFSKVTPQVLFAAIDTDNSGLVSQDEFNQAIDAMNEKELRDYSKLAFRAFDQNGDGEISKQEFHDSISFLRDSELTRLRSALARNELSITQEKEDTDETPSVNFGARVQNTVEVMVSKIFPAGFGWQAASVVADGMGMQSTDPSFWLTVGCGDAIGVMIGHMAWNAGAKALGREVDLNAQFQTAVLLGTACIFSGGGWQPLVEFLHGTAGLGFNGTAAGTVVGCGTLFFMGLRFGRLAWGKSGILPAVADNSYSNLKADAGLSVAIGGATGAFVGTDCSFGTGATDSNWLRGVVGVEDATSTVGGMIKAGSSTSIGFMGVQMAENVVLPAGKNWVD